MTLPRSQNHKVSRHCERNHLHRRSPRQCSCLMGANRCGWCCLVGTAGVGGREGGVVFDWGLLAPPALFLFVNTLAGNVVIIVAEASICSLGGGLPSFQIHFPQVLMGGRGGWGAQGGGVHGPALFTQKCRRARQPGCLRLYRLMVRPQLAPIDAGVGGGGGAS